MAAPAVKNAPAQNESKSSKKKRSKAERTESPAPAASTPEQAASISPNEGGGEESENAYIRELAKNIRNLNKKLTNVSKTDAVISEHVGKSLEELVSLKVINADQKAQVLKKPAIAAQLAQAEEQLAQVKKFDLEYRTRSAAELTQLEKTLTTKYEQEKADAVSEAEAKAKADAKKSLSDSLLVVSQFLRIAAARRAEESNPELDENLAMEGVLLQVYSGDENGVATMVKLVHGSDDKTKSVTGDVLQTTFAQVKSAASAHSAPLYNTEPAAEVGDAAVESKAVPETDPTVAHAGLTEIEDGTATALTNGHVEDSPTATQISNADVADNAANAVAESQWDTGNSMIMSQEWVEVPREASQPDAGYNAAPPALTSVQSWADDAPDSSPEGAAPTDPNDGFHQVQARHRGRGNLEGGNRGRGGYRGRGGFRGDGRGRGRGRGGPHRGGPRRTDEQS